MARLTSVRAERTGSRKLSQQDGSPPLARRGHPLKYERLIPDRLTSARAEVTRSRRALGWFGPGRGHRGHLPDEGAEFSAWPWWRTPA